MLQPLELFGLSIPIEEKTLKKQYATIASMCHPARQGNEEQYWMVTMAYYYLKNNVQNETFESFLFSKGGYQEGCTKEFMTIQELEDIVFDREDFRKMWEEARSNSIVQHAYDTTTNIPIPMNETDGSTNEMMDGYSEFSNYMVLEPETVPCDDENATVFPMLCEENARNNDDTNTMIEIRVIKNGNGNGNENENESVKRRRLL